MLSSEPGRGEKRTGRSLQTKSRIIVLHSFPNHHLFIPNSILKKKKNLGLLFIIDLKIFQSQEQGIWLHFFFWNQMLATTVKTPLSCTCHVPYVQSVPTATMDNGSSLFKVQEEDNRDYSCETARAHAPDATPTHCHTTSHFQGELPILSHEFAINRKSGIIEYTN